MNWKQTLLTAALTIVSALSDAFTRFFRRRSARESQLLAFVRTVLESTDDHEVNMDEIRNLRKQAYDILIDFDLDKKSK